jgi:hypothetical protein
MATVPRVLCDKCGSDRDVDVVTVVFGRRPPWEADLCAADYDHLFGVLQRKGRRATKSNVRPQHRFEKLGDDKITL